MSVCPLSNCSIAWNSISVGSLTQSQYSEGERIMLAERVSLSLYYSFNKMRDIANVMVGSILLLGKYFHYEQSSVVMEIK